ncbi:MAG: plastocyanin/azurin family copper-binding protein [Panacibacter sp.]
MKKMFLLFSFAFISISSVCFATVFKVKVSDFQFKPKTVNAMLGDTIMWIWKNGVHTTTSLTIPAGAAAWDAPMDATHKKFSYKLTKTGVYNYQCNFHFTVMKGKINVSAALAAGLNNFAVSEDNAKALLNWKTVSSKDLAYFSVQRSTDAENFTEIMKMN